jgi:hypothetical protein
MNCAKAGCGDPIKLVQRDGGDFYVHTKEPKSHVAQVVLAKGPA